MDRTNGRDADFTGDVGVVVIGRNEGERLRRCLTAPGIEGLTTVYVDSGSTDGSVELATSLGVHAIALDTSRPFTAARGRNAGITYLAENYPDLSFVQLLDGDTEIDRHFIAAAVLEVHSDEIIGAVSGRLREKFAAGSKYNRLCDMEWNHQPGESETFSGNVLLRVATWRDAGGYDETLIAGEDPELSLRVRRKGWRIRTIDAEMGLHDADMHTFAQWWTRTTRTGHAFAEGADMHRAAGHYRKEVRSISVWAGVIPTFIATSGMLGFKNRFAWLGLGAAAIYPLQWWRVRGHRLAVDDSVEDAQLYATHVMIGKFAELRGVLQYRLNKLLGTRQDLVEYRSVDPAPESDSSVDPTDPRDA